MEKKKIKPDKKIKLEILNAVSHGIGVILGIIFLFMLIIPRIKNHDKIGLVAFSIYGGSFILLFSASTVYHSVLNQKAKSILRVFDHVSIYYFISGSFTPAILLLTEGSFRIFFIILIWSLAILGTIFKIKTYNKFDKTKVASLIIYMTMGWLALFLIKPILVHSSWKFLFCLVLGGIIYSAGTYFYKSKKFYYNHFIWHCFVLAAAIVHFKGFYSFL